MAKLSSKLHDLICCLLKCIVKVLKSFFVISFNFSPTLALWRLISMATLQRIETSSLDLAQTQVFTSQSFSSKFLFQTFLHSGDPALGSLRGREDCPWVRFLISSSPGRVGGSGAGPPLGSRLHRPGWSGSLTLQASGHPERLPQAAGPLVG